jgi:hypothetical protein
MNILTTPKPGDRMSQKRIQQIEQRFDRIKRALLEIGPMRPGSLTHHQWIDLSIEHSRLTLLKAD